MKIFSKESVLDESLNRIRYLFDEFPNIIVSMSGGKDSTVCFELCMIVAKEKNRLPLNVMWIDQEAEWQGTVDYMTSIMENNNVKPYWFQMPMVITNNASHINRYNYCWEEGKENEWIHPKNKLSIKENKYGTVRFHELFKSIINIEFKDKKSCYIEGMRCEEAPKRMISLTNTISYKKITYGSILKKGVHYSFNPIYDWSYTDVWKFINEKNIKYNKTYDEMYRYGVSVKNMRISNVHHETSIQSLLLIQEIEPKTWEKISKRINGANTIKHLKKKSFTCPMNLPFMFKSWEEYGLYLIDNLVLLPENKENLLKKIIPMKNIYTDEEIKKNLWRAIINTVLSNDWDFTKLINFNLRPEVNSYRKFKQGNIHVNMLKQKFIPSDAKIIIKHKLGENYDR